MTTTLASNEPIFLDLPCTEAERNFLLKATSLLVTVLDNLNGPLQPPDSLSSHQIDKAQQEMKLGRRMINRLI